MSAVSKVWANVRLSVLRESLGMVPTGPGGAPASGPGLGGRGAREEIKLRGIRGGKRSGVEGDNGGRGKVGEYLWCGGVGGGGGG